MDLFTLQERVDGKWQTIYFRSSLSSGEYYEMLEGGAHVRLLNESDEVVAEQDGAETSP